jgi:hypothetical protein
VQGRDGTRQDGLLGFRSYAGELAQHRQLAIQPQKHLGG